MRQHEKELAELRIRVAVVTFEAGPIAMAYANGTRLPWPLLVDEKRELYRAYDMLTAGFWDIWGPATWLAYAREMLRGRLPKKSEGDISQRGGDVLIDPQGVVRMHHVGQGPADRPGVERILEIVRRRERR